MKIDRSIASSCSSSCLSFDYRLRYLKLSLAAQRLFQTVSVSRKLRALDPRKSVDDALLLLQFAVGLETCSQRAMILPIDGRRR